MATQVQNRRGTTAEHSTFTGAVGELTVDTTKDTVVVHDGAVAGGRPLLREDQSNLPTSAPTTGLYNASGSLALSTNSTGRLFVTSLGRVGLNTNSPGFIFEIEHSTEDGIRLRTANTSDSHIDFADTDANGRGRINYDHVTDSMGFRTAGAERLRITSAGLVGIGTSSPGTILHAAGTVTAGVSGVANGAFDIKRSSDGLSVAGLDIDTVNSVARLSTAYSFLSFRTEGTEKVRIDGSGRVGIGTTSPADKLEVNGGGISSQTASGTAPYLLLNQAGIGAAKVSVPASQNALMFEVFNGAALQERARITSDGKLLVGTSSWSANATLVAQGNSGGSTSRGVIYLALGANNPADGTALGHLEFSDSTPGRAATISAARDGGTWTAGSSHPGRLVFSTTADGASSPTERMRISQNGNTIITANNSSYSIGNGNNTIAGVGINPGGGYNWFAVTDSTYIQRCNNTDGNVLTFLRGGTTVGSVSITSTATAYNTSSDYRLKENIIQVTDGITRLQQLKPSRFNFIADPDKTVDGFIAHEVQTVVPEAITGEKDAVDDDGNPIYQGIDQSKLVPLLTAALQEAIGEIESLKARVAALESA